jgi:hypothetical protein
MSRNGMVAAPARSPEGASYPHLVTTITQSESHRLSAIGYRPENPSHCPRPLAES